MLKLLVKVLNSKSGVAAMEWKSCAPSGRKPCRSPGELRETPDRTILSQAAAVTGVGRCNDYPAREYASSEAEAPGPQRCWGDDIVSTSWEHEAASNGGSALAKQSEEFNGVLAGLIGGALILAGGLFFGSNGGGGAGSLGSLLNKVNTDLAAIVGAI